MAEEDLIVVDSNYEFAGSIILNYGIYLNDQMNKYLLIMKYLLSNAVKDETIAEQLEGIIEQMEFLPDAIANITESISADLNAYVSEIDSVDSFLY